MERFSSRPQRPTRPQGAQPAAQPAVSNESFSEMAEVTAERPGVVGKLLVLSLILVSIAVTAFVAFAIVRGLGSQNLIEKDAYQAVFLSDGQIYFGKLADTHKQYATLEDIYYLQVLEPEAASQPVQQGENTAAQITIRKLGNEIHGPKDRMVINADQILFWENLKDDGQVADAITRYKEEQANGAAAETTAPAGDTTAPVDETTTTPEN